MTESCFCSAASLRSPNQFSVCPSAVTLQHQSNDLILYPKTWKTTWLTKVKTMEESKRCFESKNSSNDKDRGWVTCPQSTGSSEIFRTQKHSWKQQFGDYTFKLFRPQLVIVGPHFSLLLILTSVCSWTVLKPAEITLWSWEVWSLDPTRLRHWQPETSQPGCMHAGHAHLVHCNLYFCGWIHQVTKNIRRTNSTDLCDDPSTAGWRADSTITFI